MRGRSCPPHYRLLRAAPCSWKPLYSPLSYSKSPIRLRSAPFSLPAFSPSTPFLPHPPLAFPPRVYDFWIRKKNSWTTLDRKQQFLLRWMSGPVRLDRVDTFRRSLEKRGCEEFGYLSFSSGNFRPGWKDYWSKGLCRRFKGEFSENVRTNETKIFRSKGFVN